MIRAAAVLVALLSAAAASAQRPLFDPDDFLDPRMAGGRPVLISRLVAGAASNMNGDGLRPLGENVGYVHLATSFSWRSVQLDYKRSQLKAEDGEAARWLYVRQPSTANNPLPQFQQTRNATPVSRDALHAAWYWPIAAGSERIPVMLRSRLTFSSQPIRTDLVICTCETEQISGRERTFAFDTDTWFRIAGRDVFGSLAISETKTSGPPTDPNTDENRRERALTYTNRFPALSLDRPKILIRPTLTVGGISNRGGRAVNLVNPAIEVFRPFPQSGANLHVIWSPQWAANGEGWEVRHQVAVLVDRTLFVKVF